jgi:hypothetical protein
MGGRSDVRRAEGGGITVRPCRPCLPTHLLISAGLGAHHLEFLCESGGERSRLAGFGGHRA